MTRRIETLYQYDIDQDELICHVPGIGDSRGN